VSMHPHRRYGGHEGEQDELCRYGLDRDPREDHDREVELAERIAEQASLPPGHPGVWVLARYRLGRGPSPFERAVKAMAPRPPLAPGDEVTYRGEDGAGPARHGTVRRLIDEDGAAVVAFQGGGETAVSADALERRAA
jgi:hypothetical protein